MRGLEGIAAKTAMIVEIGRSKPGAKRAASMRDEATAKRAKANAPDWAAPVRLSANSSAASDGAEATATCGSASLRPSHEQSGK